MGRDGPRLAGLMERKLALTLHPLLAGLRQGSDSGAHSTGLSSAQDPPNLMEDRMKFQNPKVTDLGSIADHTFTNAGAGDWGSGPGTCPPQARPASTPPKSQEVLELDCFGEYSHPGTS